MTKERYLLQRENEILSISVSDSGEVKTEGSFPTMEQAMADHVLRGFSIWKLYAFRSGVKK